MLENWQSSSELISQTLGFLPDQSSEKLGWSNSAMFAWRGQAESCAFETSDELVVVYHTGGAREVPIKLNRASISHPSRPGLLTIIPPNTHVSWSIRGGACSYSLHLRPDIAEKSQRRLASDLADHMHAECAFDDTLLSHLLKSLAMQLSSPSEIGSLYADALAETVHYHILHRSIRVQRDEKSKLSMPLLRRIQDIIENNVEFGVSLDELAKYAGLSRSHFAKCFHNSTGLTPHHYLTMRRITRARRLLLEDDKNISAIALCCGFSSQAHFTEQFKRAVGVTPAVYRRSEK